jgi:hypothetical protein
VLQEEVIEFMRDFPDPKGVSSRLQKEFRIKHELAAAFIDYWFYGIGRQTYIRGAKRLTKKVIRKMKKKNTTADGYHFTNILFFSLSQKLLPQLEKIILFIL